MWNDNHAWVEDVQKVRAMPHTQQIVKLKTISEIYEVQKTNDYVACSCSGKGRDGLVLG